MRKKFGLLLLISGFFLACNNSESVHEKAEDLKKELDAVAVKVDSSITRLKDSGAKSLKVFKRKLVDELVKKDSVK